MATAWTRARLALGLLAALAAAPAPADPPASARLEDPPRPPLGVNLEPATSDTPLHLFADAVRQARDFYAAGARWGTKVAVDADGWPTGDAVVMLGVGATRLVSDRPYRLSFKGVAKVHCSSGEVRNLAHDAASNVTTAEVLVREPADTYLLLEDAWRRADHAPDAAGQRRGVTAIRLLRPGQRDGDLFDADLLARLAHFSVVRPAVGGRGVNWNGLVRWDDRVRPAAPLQAGYEGARFDAGMAWEYHVLLANAAGADLYLTLPIGLDDDHVRRLALLLKHGSDGAEPYPAPQARPAFPPLAEGRAVYLEYGNELWNEVFDTTRENRRLARQEHARGDPHHYGPSTPRELGARRAARRLIEISAIFRGVFGDAAMGTRVRPLLAGQLVDPASFDGVLDYVGAVYGAANRHGNPPRRLEELVYGLAAAPYLPDVPRPAGVDAVFSSWRGGGAASIDRAVEALAAIARRHGLALVAYEAGQHLLPATGGAEAKAAAQLDPRMRQALLDLYHHWYAAGGGLALHYSLCGGWGPWGFWGLSDDLASEATPKWQALKELEAGR
ncbi:MAG TPA: hypothetical protein VFP50_02565 [Anaeromyxobacteraceae bacterium]|nr:hypothetical protein [Anaeromyxobacteraceae bacterium]